MPPTTSSAAWCSRASAQAASTSGRSSAESTATSTLAITEAELPSRPGLLAGTLSSAGNRTADRPGMGTDGGRPSRAELPEAVADAAGRRDLGVRGDRAQLAPQPRDVLVERVVVDDGALGPCRADEVLARHDRAGLGGERGQQAELGRGEQRLVLPLAQSPRHGVEAQRADGRGRLRVGAAQKLAEPGEDLV